MLKWIHQEISKFGHQVLSRNPYQVLGIGLTFFIFKSGIRGILPWSSFEPVEKFPELQETLSSYSLGLLAVSHLFRANTEIRFFLLNLVLLILFFLIAFVLLRVKSNSSSLTVFLILVFIYSPIGIVLFGNIGRHDLLTIFGYVFFFILIDRKSRYIGIALGVLGSPEHFLVGWIFALITALLLGNRELICHCKKALLASVTLSIPLFLYVSLQTNSQNRLTNILTEMGYMKIGLRNFLSSFPLELYSYFGFLTPVFLFLLCLIGRQSSRTFIFLLLVFTFPMLINIIIVDKTRDYVIALLASFLILVKNSLTNPLIRNSLEETQNKFFLVGLLTLLMLFSPSIEVTFEGNPRAPHEWTVLKILEYCGMPNPIC